MDICYCIRTLIQKQDTNYCYCIPIEVRICCCLYKLGHGCNLLSCSEQFAIGCSTLGLVIHEVVAITIAFGHIVQLPVGIDMWKVMIDFKNFCGMPSIHGTINYINIAMSKPFCLCRRLLLLQEKGILNCSTSSCGLSETIHKCLCWSSRLYQ